MFIAPHLQFGAATSGRDCSGYYLQFSLSVCWQTAATAGSTRIAYKNRDGTKIVSAESPAASIKKLIIDEKYLEFGFLHYQHIVLLKFIINLSNAKSKKTVH